MLILSTYRVVLHPSCVQTVFSLIISIQERYSFTILSENSRAPGGAPWAELKSDEHLSTDHQQNAEIWCCLTYHLQFWIMTGIFIAGTAPSFSIKRCANPVSIWALFIKHSSTNTLAKLHCCPENQTASTVHVTLGSFGTLNNVIFPLQPTTHFFRDILPERVPSSALMGALLLSLWSMCARVRSSGRNAHIRSSTLHYVRKSHDWKKLSDTCTNPEGRFLAQKYSVILPNRFLKLWPCLAWESNSLTV